MEALTNETLTKEQVTSLINMSDYKNIDFNYRNRTHINKGWYETWDGERHDGYIVTHVIKRPTEETKNDYWPQYEEHRDYYFMECVNHDYHALVPITDKSSCHVLSITSGNNVIDHIVRKAVSSEKWNYILDENKNIIPLTSDNFNCQELTYDEELLEVFSSSTLPSKDDDIWYKVLSMGYGQPGYDLERKVINVLKNHGHSVKIVGEKDSFGWVSRGIEVDGELKAIY